MKKISIFLLLMAFFAPLAMNGQNRSTLTVYGDNTTTNEYVPIYGYYCDEKSKCEFIIPAEKLSAMNGGVVSDMKFYLSSSNSSNDISATFNVFVKEVSATTLTGFTGTTNATTVYNSTISIPKSQSNMVLDIPFSSNYVYGGGNLLIGVYQTGNSSYNHTYWTGENQSGNTAWQGYGSGSGSGRTFLPKTTFTYEISTTPSIILPATATVLTGFTTTLTATTLNVTGTPSISYTTSNTSVATVSGSGTSATVTAVAPGTATITATMTYQGTDYHAQCVVTVEDPSYCDPAFSDPSDDYIKNFVTTGGTTNISNSSTYETGGYSDYYSTKSASITAGETLTCTVTPSSTSYKYGHAIWVDWNNDYEFSSTEKVAYSAYSATGNWEGTFTIPANTAAGDYRMRVIHQYTSSNTNPATDPCVSSTYGEAEDYKLTVTASNPCTAPTNLQASQVGTTTAHLSWNGTNDSYVLQYRTAGQDMNMSVWQQVDDDVVTTHTYTQYSFDLSDYAGQTGYIAIRHYAVEDRFILAIDDIEVTDANGTVVLTEGFDSGIPSSWDNIDYDGDGYVWGSTSSSLVNNSYCAYSESYNNDTYSALTPDNWLIIPNVTLGGTLTLYALGLDSQGYHDENFGVFVATQSYAAVPAGAWSAEIPAATTSHDLTGLTANTPYEWRVKGICNGYSDPSNWATSSFTTIAEGFKTFVTEGNWDVANNWFPVGVPAITDEVTITAPVTIPANVVGLAKKATIETGGSITIEDGGQLKHGSASVKVTMKKNIAGYGAGNENDKDHYYFFASPFGGITQLTSNTNWSKVLHLTEGNYDLYGFDPTASDGLEWINYETSSSHSLFTSSNNIEGLQDGIGYLYANEENKVLEFIGTAAKCLNVTKTIDYTYDSQSTDQWNGWTLLGNPYTCNAYISYVDGNGDALTADFYTLNNSNTYALLTSNNALAPCASALINYSATGKVQFSSEAPAKSTGMINMNLVKGNKTVDQARVRFGEGYNLKHMSFRNNSKLYMPVENNDYAVVYSEEQNEMPVNFKAEENGSYTISFNTENVELGYLHLIDNMTGNDVDLLANPSYSFNAKTTDYESRFKLVFATGNNDDTFAFYSNGNFVINNEGEATLQVIDINGRIVKSESINGCANINVNAAQGIYMLRLVNGDNVKVQKVVVR